MAEILGSASSVKDSERVARQEMALQSVSEDWKEGCSWPRSWNLG